MTTLPNFNALVRAMELLSTPYIAEVLACLQRDVQPADALSDADNALIENAVQRLMAVTAVYEVTAPADAARRPVLALTPKGREVAPIIQDLVAEERRSPARAVKSWTSRARHTDKR